MVQFKDISIIKKIEEQIQILKAIDIETLLQGNNLPNEFDFDGVTLLIKEYLEQFQPLFNRDLSKLPFNQLDSIQTSFSTVINLTDELLHFGIEESGNIKDDYTKIISKFMSTRNEILNGVLLPVAVTGIQAIDIDSIHQKTNGVVKQFEIKYQALDELLENSIKEQNNHRKEAENTLANIRKMSAYAGVSANAEAFHTQSNAHSDSANNWIGLTWASVLITAGVAVYFLYSASEKSNIPESVPEAIQYIFAKLVIFSTLTFTIIWCSKNYKSHKHNQILYDHRATTLNTFEAFYNGSKDEHVKDAILLQAAYAAFANRQTGFESIQEKDSPPAMQIVDVLNKTVRTAGSVSKDAGHA
tara:strand:+ start:721 stop:1794 length:1074 start_codon:yes stop_codon:yes gene_type:complete